MLVRGLGLGDGRPSPHRQHGWVPVLSTGQLLEPAVHLGVDPADEERRDAVDPGEVDTPDAA